MSNVSDKRCRGNQNTHFVVKNFFPECRAVYVEKYGTAKQATDENTAQKRCDLHAG